MSETNGRAWIGRAGVLWALRDAGPIPAHLVATLVVIAAHAGEDGRNAWPSLDTISAWTRKHPRNVQRDIRELRALGLLLPGDPAAAKVRPDRHRPVYDLAMPRHGVHATAQAPHRGPSRNGAGVAASSSRHGAGVVPRHGAHVANATAHTSPEQSVEQDVDKNPSSAGPRRRAALAVLAAFPMATDDEIGAIIDDRAARGARDVAAVIRHEHRALTLALPCDPSSRGRLSTACRAGNPDGCAAEWCADRCHLDAEPFAP